MRRRPYGSQWCYWREASHSLLRCRALGLRFLVRLLLYLLPMHSRHLLARYSRRQRRPVRHDHAYRDLAVVREHQEPTQHSSRRIGNDSIHDLLLPVLDHSIATSPHPSNQTAVSIYGQTCRCSNNRHWNDGVDRSQGWRRWHYLLSARDRSRQSTRLVVVVFHVCCDWLMGNTCLQHSRLQSIRANQQRPIYPTPLPADNLHPLWRPWYCHNLCIQGRLR